MLAPTQNNAVEVWVNGANVRGAIETMNGQESN